MNTATATPRTATALGWVLTAAVVATATTLVWWRRWVSDDGFINIRVIHQLMAGRGPVYNPGERVEVGTSTLWLALVWAGQALSPDTGTGQVMVVLGTTLTAVAFCLVAIGAAAMQPRVGPVRPLVPAGLAVLAALPPVWDFGTSGLETSLSMAWIAACFAGLARRARQDQPRAAWRPWGLSVLIGVGVLVRPDFGLLSVGFAVALLWQSRRRPSEWLAAAAIALALPAAYQVFRMGFYASLVPNTALAKANAPWQQGLVYLWDFVGTYWLVVPLALAAWLAAAGFRRSSAAPAAPARSLYLILPVTALVHAGFVVSVGGDFMHGRFLLPATWLVFAPVALVPFRGWNRPAVALTLAWALASGLLLRPALWNGMIADERSYYARFVPDRPGASVELENWSSDVGFQLTRQAAADQAAGQYYYLQIEHPTEKLARDGTGVVVVMNSLGVAGVASGIDVVVNDPPSLGDPIGSRLVLPRDAQFRIGHAYKPEVWAIARYALGDRSQPVAGLAEARRTLACPRVTELLHAVTDPLTPQRFIDNLLLAPRLTFLRIPVEPADAASALCP